MLFFEEEKSMIHSFTVTFGAKYLTGMVFLPTKLSVLLSTTAETLDNDDDESLMTTFCFLS
jgi:hypothetical protein